MVRVLSITSSRADVGILAPVWRALAAVPDVELHVWATGMHQAPGAYALSEVPAGIALHRGGADLGGRDAGAAAAAMASIGTAAGTLIAELHPDTVLVMGDRLDMLPAATATVPFNLPLVHLHGGEETRGAVDDRVRHAMTKLAHLHCVANVAAAGRVAGMGEEPWRIHVTGAPGLDSLLEQEVMTGEAFAAEVGLDDGAGIRLVTVHPETGSTDPAAPLDAILEALDAAPGPTLFTAANSDPGGRAIADRIDAFAAARPWVRMRGTLGGRLYANALRHAALMIGNSSSGIIEAGLFGLPVINVGRRQQGRLRGANVHDCKSDARAVTALISTLAGKRYPAEGSLYGDGKAGPRVAHVLTHLPPRERLLDKRIHSGPVTFEAPWAAPAGADA